ncbi:MAG: DUF4159 domain-containing protein [Pararhizobium sp.]
MAGLPFAFGAPAVLFGLIALPVIWWLLSMTPPRPRDEVFPPLRILARVLKKEETPSKSPWWLTLLRLAMAALVILALADPVINPEQNTVSRDGPLTLVVDNSWATAPDWRARLRTANALIDAAEKENVPVSLTLTAEKNNDPTPTTASAARDRLAAAKPRPTRPDRQAAARALRTALGETRPGSLVYLADGIETKESPDALKTMLGANPHGIRLVEGDPGNAVALTSAANGANGFRVHAVRLDPAGARTIPLAAFDSKGRSIAGGSLHFDAGKSEATGTIDAPFELRNDFARVAITGLGTSGAVYLLDDSFRRRRVALLSGEPLDSAQPLLSPLYYVRRALQPYADLVEPKDSDLVKAVPELLAQHPSVLVMTDIGTLPTDLYPKLQKWIEDGGMLIRFAGPRLAGETDSDPLIPVRLRAGERALGGTMSWSEPQKLAAFPASSPFAGMDRPKDVTVKRQVLAEPSPDLEGRTWASLTDGTPLVTSRTLGSGRIVLFHVTAAATWSNLPLSGTFVEMLRRTVQLSHATATNTRSASGKPQSLPPFRLLDANGALVQPSGDARPIEVSGNTLPAASLDHPPGLYGTKDGFRALNLMRSGDMLAALTLPQTTVPVTHGGLAATAARSLKPWLFGAAMILLMIDSLVVLAMGGALSLGRLRGGVRTGAASLILALAVAGALAAFAPPHAFAADTKPGDDQILDKIDTTHLAYVVTGDADVDRVSEQGLYGLSQYLTYRTALEPGKPVGVDIEHDPLAFYPLIYWPMSANGPMPSDAAISRIDAYMKNGGTVLFDTRDQMTTLTSGGAVTPETQRLRAILANLDVPPLEPVPPDHVLTKAFYLLSNFPGRYAGGQMWVEAQPDAKKEAGRPARAGDGVSSIIITSNDLAGAWALDESGSPLYPTVPNDPEQREYAFRVGVNIVMYMLTGNYKADQVHVPALLERLGQ